MPNSYVTFTGDGSNKTFSFAGIDDYLSTSYLKVYINNSLVNSANYTIDTAGSNENIVFAAGYAAPALGATVKISRETPNTSAGFASNIVDFTDGSVLTASDLDKGFKGMLHIVQEANDTGSGALPKTADGLAWDAGAKRITNGAIATEQLDYVTKSQLDALALYGVPVTIPQSWSFTGTGAQTAFTLSSPAPNATNAELYIVEVGGILQRPGASPNGDYTISGNTLTFTTGAPGNGVGIRVRNFGVARSALDVLPNGSVTNAYLATDAVATANILNGAVTSDKLASSSVVEEKIASNAVTNAKIATDAIATANIQNLQVTEAKIANNAVTESKLGTSAVTTDKISGSAVTNAKIAGNAVNFAQMNQGTGASAFGPVDAATRYMKVDPSGVLTLAAITTIPANNPASDLDFGSTTGSNGYKITGLKNPTNTYDAANKDFVEGPRIGQTTFVAMSLGSVVFNLSGKSTVTFTGTTVGTLACPAGQTYSGILFGSNGGYAKYDVTSSGSTITGINGGYGGTTSSTSLLAILTRTS